MPDIFRILSTPNPAEVALAVGVAATQLRPDNIPAPGTAYRDISYIRHIRASEGWDTYQYSGMSDAGDDGTVMFFFAKAKSAAEKAVPFRTAKRFGDHPWPPILHDLQFLRDFTFPRATSTVSGNQPGVAVMPNYSTRETYTPGINGGTLFFIDEFFAPTPFDIPQYQIPVPTSISYDINGIEGRFPECLHDDIIIPDMRTGVQQVTLTADGGGVGEALGGTLAGQIFPKTNFKTWAPYYTSDDQKFTSGGWHRIRIRVVPPAKPEVIVS